MAKFTHERISMIHGVLLISLFACAAFYIGDAQFFKEISFSPMIIGIILGMLYATICLRHGCRAYSSAPRKCFVWVSYSTASALHFRT